MCSLRMRAADSVESISCFFLLVMFMKQEFILYIYLCVCVYLSVLYINPYYMETGGLGLSHCQQRTMRKQLAGDELMFHKSGETKASRIII